MTTPRSRLISAVLATITTVLLSAAPALAGPAVNHRSDATLRTLVTSVTAAGVPGALARVQEDREVRQAAAGVADLATGAPLRPEARFRAGSVTKTFVATIVLQLVGEGRLHLDEPIERRLPGLVADGDRITVRHLLNHTSGLSDYTQDPAVLAGIAANRVFTPRELVAIGESHPRQSTPGSAWAYSNTNYIVAGLLVEAVTETRLGRVMRRRLFEPLDLRHTTFADTVPAIHRDLAHGYVPVELVPTPDGKPFDVTSLNTSAAWAAGAIVSNAGDLSRFYGALMGGRLLTADLMREMTTTVPEDPSDPGQFRYGLGIERVVDPCGANWGHGGRIFGYQSMAYWNEKTGRTVVLASTMFPSPVTAEEPLAKLTDVALCELAIHPPR